MEDVRSRLQRGDLGRQRPVLEQQRGIGQSDGHFGRVLHLDQDVDGTVELGEGRAHALWRIRQLGGSRQLPNEAHPFLGALEQQDIAFGDHAVAVGIELPLAAPAYGEQPHPSLAGQEQLP